MRKIINISRNGGNWKASLVDYDGPPAPSGWGYSKDQAIDSLLEAIELRYDIETRREQYEVIEEER